MSSDHEDPDFDPLDISAYEARGSEHRGVRDIAEGETVEGVEYMRLETDQAAEKVARLGVAQWRKNKHQRDFLEAFARTGNVTQSCAIAGVSRGLPAQWKREDEAFAAAYLDAFEISVDALEAQARHLALHGVDEPVIHMGQIVAYKTKYSESMLALLLKAKRRNEFGDKVEMNHDVKGGVLVVPGVASEGDWEKNAIAQQAEYRGDGRDES